MIIPKNWSTMKKLMFLQQTGGGSVVIEDTVSGNPVVFTTDLAKPLRRLALSLLPRQSGSGDPSPQNIRSLIPWGEVGTWTGGKNLFDTSIFTENGGVLQENGLYYFPNLSYLLNKVFYKNNGYTGQLAVTLERQTDVDRQSLRATIYYTDGTSEKVGAKFSTGEVDTYKVITASGKIVDRITGDYGSNIATYARLQIELGSTATAYESPTITPHPVNLTGITPPVYGASLDLTTGEVWGTYALWTKNTASMDNADNVPGWRNSGIRELIGAGQNKEFGDQIMNVGKYWSANTNSSNDILFLRSARYNDMSQSDWQALAIDVQIAVELATPVLLATLTPQQVNALVGVNTVWSDADNIDLTFLKKR